MAQASDIERRKFARILARRMVALRSDEEAVFQEKVTLRHENGTEYTVTLAHALEDLISATWPSHNNDDSAARKRLMDDFALMRKDIQEVAIDVMAHAGQLHQMTGLLARENLFKNADPEKNPVRNLLKLGGDKKNPVLPYTSVEDAISAFGKPAFEMTLTGHPTNTNGIHSMELQRVLAGEAMAYGQGLPNNVDDALREFGKAQLLPTDEQGKPTMLSVQDETNTMRYFLGNLFNDLPGVYQNFDRELGRFATEKQAQNAGASSYNPEDLKLNYQFHLWGASGDKDGNQKVNGDTTLAAVSALRADIFSRYAKTIGELGLDTPQSRRITDAANALAPLNEEIQDTLKKQKNETGNTFFTPKQFTDFSARVQAATQQVDLAEFQRELTPAVQQAWQTGKTDAEKYAPLNLLRQVRTFGAGFGHLEYRETAEEYERVVKLIAPEYAAIIAPLDALRAEHDEAKKTKNIPLKLELEAKMAEEQQRIEPARQTFLSELLKDPAKLQQLRAAAQDQLKAGVDYSGDDAGPIAYHTLKRMELARDFPDIIQNNVLAECQGASNMLEAVLLQHAVEKDGKRAVMGVVPLFEEHATLHAAPGIVKDAISNFQYQQHLAEVRQAHGGENWAQQVQLAHSDNAKRAGVAASRALLFQAHDALRNTVSRYSAESGNTIDLQFFEGGSQSDPYRGGVRAISATINEFGLHKFTKMTYQGGDLLNYFNLPYSTNRLLTKCLSTQIEGQKKHKILKLSALSNFVIQAFDDVKSSYIDKFFNSEAYVNFLNKIDYVLDALFGNRSSRAPNRDGKKELSDINTTRAIGISEALQHSEIAATWVGIGNLEELLAKYNGKARRKEDKIGETAEELNRSYNLSPPMGDIVDRMMYGLMRSDLNFAEKKTMGPDGEDPMMKELRKDYAIAFKLCMEAYTGQQIEAFGIHAADLKDDAKLHELIRNDTLRNIIKREVFPHIKDILDDQQRQLDLAHHMQGWEAAKVDKGQPMSDETLTTNTLIHNFMDSVHHGRITQIDDPSSAKLFCAQQLKAGRVNEGFERKWATHNMDLRKELQAADKTRDI